jgi:superfamily II DNA or RNA helicase
MTLRDYQQELFEKIYQCFQRGVRNPLVVAPTGAGKTVLFSYIANRASQGGKRVIILVHRKELVTQTSKTLSAFGIPHGIIQSGITPNPSRWVQIAMVQTISRRLASISPPSLLIVDECHHMAAGDYRKIVAAYPRAHVIGFTATPQRLDGKGLSDFFSEIILGPSVEWLMANSFLSRPKYYAPRVVADFSRVTKRMGDYAAAESAAVMDTKSITGDAVEHYRRLCPNAPAIAFCVTVAHAQHVAEQFCAAGIPAATIHAGMSADARRKIVIDLAEKRILVMTSCDIVSEGFDVPIVVAAILLRPTTSLGLHLQQVGRVLRLFPGKTHAVILDHVGNLARHGLAEMGLNGLEREWTLAGTGPKKKGKAVPTTMKTCKKCFCMFNPAPTCPECGTVVPIPPARKLSVIEGNLEEFRIMPIHLALKSVSSRDDLKLLAKARGYHHGWVNHVEKELGLTE